MSFYSNGKNPRVALISYYLKDISSAMLYDVAKPHTQTMTEVLCEAMREITQYLPPVQDF